MTGRLLTPQQVADRLALTEQHVRHLCARGDIPGAVRLGGPRSAVRIPEESVDQWIATRLPASA